MDGEDLNAPHKRRDMPADVVIAEASAWIVRMNSPSPTPADQAAFKEWLQADSAHAHAYQLAARMWDIVPRAARTQRAGRPSRRNIGVTAAAACVVAAVSAFFWWTPPSGHSYSTAVGEQRTVILSDGTKVTLNTDSALRTRYTQEKRLAYLEHGEALFEVAKNPRRPFIVEAAGERVRAVGTSFVVRVDANADPATLEHGLAVTLIEGRVEVEPVDAAELSGVAVLAPGERATIRTSRHSAAPSSFNSGVSIDQPPLSSVAAWRRGDVVFEDVSLQEALTELHRYGGPEVQFQEEALKALRVSGVFGLHDIPESIQALAEVHHLSLHRSSDVLILGY